MVIVSILSRTARAEVDVQTYKPGFHIRVSRGFCWGCGSGVIGMLEDENFERTPE